MELGPMLGFLMVSFCLSEQLGPPYDLNSDLTVAPAAPLCEMASPPPVCPGETFPTAGAAQWPTVPKQYMRECSVVSDSL